MTRQGTKRMINKLKKIVVDPRNLDAINLVAGYILMMGLDGLLDSMCWSAMSTMIICMIAHIVIYHIDRHENESGYIIVNALGIVVYMLSVILDLMY